MSQKLPNRSETAPPPAGRSPAADDGDLPEGWAVERLGECSELNPRHSKAIDDTTPVTFVPMTSVRESSPDLDLSLTRSLAEVRKGYTHFADGDVLFAKITPCMENGKGAVAKSLVNGMGCGSTELHVLRPRGGIDPYYTYRFLQQESVRRTAAENFTGSAGQLRVPTTYLEELELPLPPLAEQRRIVGKLEAVLGKVSASRERLARVPGLLKRFRQSVLAAACSGKLTADWRVGNRECGDVSKIISAIEERRRQSVRTAAAIQKLNDVYSTVEIRDSNELPEEWAYVSLNKVCESFDYGTSSKSAVSGQVPVLRMGNIQDGKLDWTDLVFTSDASEIDKYNLLPNTVLFNRTNSPELVGKTAIYRGERPAIFAGYLIRVNNCDELDAEYLNMCLNTNDAREFCNDVKTDGVSQSNINAQKLGTFEVPLPPLAEQHEIVRRVERLFALADRLEAQLRAAQTRVDKLTQAVLAKAFRGELVPTEADLARREARPYEPAHELLARIRDQQTTTPPSKAPRKPRK